LSDAVADVLDDSILQVDVQIDNAKSAVKKGRGRKKMPSSAKKAAVTSQKPTIDMTPVQSRRPPASSQTPMITPKFNTTAKLNRTVSRAAKAGEVLVSLSGSPVMPVVTARSKAGKKIAGSNAQIPLGDGSTLNMPLEDDAELEENALDLDDEQRARLEQLHHNLGNMLKIKAQNKTMDS
jgi:borealin